MPRTIDLAFTGATLGTADDTARPHTYRMRTWGASKCQQVILDLPAAVGTSIAAMIVSAASGSLTSPAAQRLVDLLSQKPIDAAAEQTRAIKAHADVLELVQLGLERLTTGQEVERVIESIMGTDILTLFCRLASGSLIRVEPAAPLVGVECRMVEIDVVPLDKAAFSEQEKTGYGVDEFYSGERFAELLPLVAEMLRRNLGPLARRSMWSAVMKLGNLVPDLPRVSSKASSPVLE